jgi:methyl-accepting chemotaxis protein
MAAETESVSSFSRRLFIFTTSVGLIAGVAFPPIAALMVGSKAYGWPFMVTCLIAGQTFGAILFLTVRSSLTRQLRQYLHLLQLISEETIVADGSIEDLERSLQQSVEKIRQNLGNLLTCIDTFLPHYQELAQASGFLSNRTAQGISAAHAARGNIETLAEKQRQIAAEMELLLRRSRGETVISQQLSNALQEMAQAMERSNDRFLETTATVDEMAGSVRQVASEAEQIARAVEVSAHDLGGIDESMARIRTEAQKGANAAESLRGDAEEGLTVVDAAISEMERIDHEGEKTRLAMQRLAVQAAAVNKIIKVMRELVSDTELLAFNAAIIAAQAGEGGRGFAVVAEEIGDLAERTRENAQEIAGIVQAIATESADVTAAVAATGERIGAGKAQSHSAGNALRKIVASSAEAAATTAAIVEVTEEQQERTRTLIAGMAQGTSSVRAIARAIHEQQLAIERIQCGVIDMKGASDLMARGMEEQISAKQAFDAGLYERGEQFKAINDAVRLQLTISEKVLEHFATSEERLQGNAERTATIDCEILALEEIARALEQLANRYGAMRRRK